MDSLHNVTFAENKPGDRGFATNEELMIARHNWRVIGTSEATGRQP